MNKNIVLSDEFALLTRRLNNAREFIRMRKVDKVNKIQDEVVKILDEVNKIPDEVNKIPDDFDERIELYLKNKK